MQQQLSLLTLLLLLLSLAASAVAADDSDANDANSMDTDASTASSSPPHAPPSIFNAVDGVVVPGAILAVVAMLSGVAIAIAGFKLFRAALCALGFALGGTLAAVVVERAFEHEAHVRVASWVAFICGGALCGVIAACVFSAGLFFAGAAAGALLATMAHTTCLYKVYPSHPDVVLVGAVIVLGALCGALVQRVVKPGVILATSLVGAALIVWGVGYFAGEYPSAAAIASFQLRDGTYALPSVWRIYSCVTLLIAFGSTLLQLKLTARGVACPRSYDAAGRTSLDGYGAFVEDHDDDDGTATGTSSTAAAVSRRKVVVIARRDHIADTELEPHASQPGYAIV